MGTRRKASGRRAVKPQAPRRAQRRAGLVQLDMFAAPVELKTASARKPGTPSKPPRPRRRNDSVREDVVQTQVAETLARLGAPGVFWFHPANGGKRSPRTAAQLKRQGVRAGTPDLALTIDGRSHFLELKRQKGGVVSAEQRAIGAEIEAAGGVWALARGYDAAVTVLRSWGALAI